VSDDQHFVSVFSMSGAVTMTMADFIAGGLSF
jgi:hypothetical protein